MDPAVNEITNFFDKNVYLGPIQKLLDVNFVGFRIFPFLLFTNKKMSKVFNVKFAASFYSARQHVATVLD